MNTRLFLVVLLTAAFFLGACGPSAEQIATMTASAWTPTPVSTNTPLPTPTATPLPYDLTVKVTDTNGNPIAGALVVFPESGNKNPIEMDASGQYAWSNLNGPNVSLTVTAQGYFRGEQGALLERGPNEVIVTLERDPFGLLPSQACASGETLLYAEDFQDGAVENWGAYPPGTTVLIEADPTQADNKALSLNFGGTDGEYQVNTIPQQENVTVRLKYLPGNHSRFNTGWGKGDMGYYIILSADELSLNFSSKATGEQKLAHSKPVMAQGIWHLLEMSRFNNHIEVWVDGQMAISYDGAQALTEGHILGIGSAFLPPDSIVHIDDVSVCGLNAPFASTYVAP